MKSIRIEMQKHDFGIMSDQIPSKVVDGIDTKIWYGVGDPISVDFVHSIMNEVMRQQ